MRCRAISGHVDVISNYANILVLSLSVWTSVMQGYQDLVIIALWEDNTGQVQYSNIAFSPSQYLPV